MTIAELFNPESNGVYIVAELSANHGGDINIARQTIEAAKACGADAIKLQTYTADTLTLDSDAPAFRIDSGTLWDGKRLYDLYTEASMPWEWQPELKRYAESLGLELFSSPFDKTAVDFLEAMQVPAYKIASFEINDLPLIAYAASQGKPMILSTGVADFSEIVEAVQTCRDAGNEQIILLKCTSSYPAPVEEANLKTLQGYPEFFHTIPGLSDHTLGTTVPAAAAALGARMIEKHFILDRSIGGPDSSFSLEPNEFKQMVESVRETVKALGSVQFSVTQKAKSGLKFKRSLFVAEEIRQGELFTEHNIRSVRPSDGIAPKFLPDILGKTATRDLAKGTALAFDMINDLPSSITGPKENL